MTDLYKKYFEMFEFEGEPVYNKEKTKNYFRIATIAGVFTALIVNQKYREASTLTAHFISGLIGAMGVKTWYMIPDLMDAAEEAGAVYSHKSKEEDN